MLFGSLIERKRDGDSLDATAAHHNFNGTAGFGEIQGQITHPDVLIQCRRRSSAGHPTSRDPVNVDFVPIAADTPALHFKTNELARNPAPLLLLERIAAQKVAFIELDNPI